MSLHFLLFAKKYMNKEEAYISHLSKWFGTKCSSVIYLNNTRNKFYSASTYTFFLK